MHQQPANNMAAPHEDTELEKLLQSLTQIAGGKQDRKPNQDVGQEVTPKEGFVVKTTDQHGQKVFINICSSDKVPMAGSWANGKVPEDVTKQIEHAAASAEGYAESECLRFPLSLGETKHEKDNKGEACTVCDVVFNDVALKQADHFRPLKVYLINMAMGWVQQKKEIELDPKYKLPKMRYKGNNGNVTPQTMRMDAKPLVTEMRDVPEAPQFPLLTKKRPITVPGAPKAYKEPLKASTDPPQAPTAKTPTSTKAFSSNKPAQAKQASSSAILKEAATQPPQAQPVATTLMNGAPVPSGQAELVSAVEFIGRPVDSIAITVDWPAHATAASMADSTAEVAGEHVYIDVPGCKPLDVQLPFAVTTEDAVVRPAKENRQWQIRLKYLPCRQLLQQVMVLQLRQSKPHQTEALDLAYDSYLELEP